MPSSKRTSATQPPPIIIADTVVPPKTRKRIEIQAARLATGTWLSLPVEVVHGAKAGPALWVSAAVHGDEINGVEVIRRVLKTVSPKKLNGTLIAVPIVNVFGFIEQSRYLPDRRDLNRSFPGSASGSLASRLARLFMTEIVDRCTHGIDLHTGSNHRSNLPQLRADLENPATRACALAFAPPVMMHSKTRDGSLRQAAAALGIPMLLYEAGEPLRFDEDAIGLAVDGVLRVMSHLGMWTEPITEPEHPPVYVGSSSWIRARRGGILRSEVRLGQRVDQGEELGVIADAFGDHYKRVLAKEAGIVIGQTNNPLVNQGDGLFHIGQIEESVSKSASD